jgi:hypothetical protein
MSPVPTPGVSPHEAIAYTNQVAILVQKINPHLYLPVIPPGCTDCNPRILNIGGCGKFGQVPAELSCAKTVAGFFGGARHAPPESGGQGGGGSGSRWQPLGELVSVNLELAGLKGQRVVLSWPIYPENGSTGLPEKWLGNFVAYRLVATTDDDTGTLDMWIPLPRQQGPYFIRVTLALGDADLASMSSGPFG